MDEDVFRSIARGYDAQRCHFARAILISCAGCGRSQRVLIAERESVHCMSRVGHERCGTMVALMREKALFALGRTHAGQSLPHGKEMKVECGGLDALSHLLGQPGAVDIDTLLQAAEGVYGSLAAIPYDEVVRSISHYSLRRRSKPGNQD